MDTPIHREWTIGALSWFDEFHNNYGNTKSICDTDLK